MLTTRVLDADEALRHGIVSHVVQSAELDDEARKAATTIAAMSPLAVRAWRQNLLDIATPTVQKAIHDELLAQMLVYTSEDFAEFRACPGRGPPAELPHHLNGKGALHRVPGGVALLDEGARRLRSCCG